MRNDVPGTVSLIIKRMGAGGGIKSELTFLILLMFSNTRKRYPVGNFVFFFGLVFFFETCRPIYIILFPLRYDKTQMGLPANGEFASEIP